MINEIHVGDVGTIFRATIRDQDNAIKDVSLASTKQLIFLKPDKSVVVHDASFYTDGIDGVIQWTTTSVDDLDLPHLWKMQGVVTIGGSQKSSDIVDFKVFPNLS